MEIHTSVKIVVRPNVYISKQGIISPEARLTIPQDDFFYYLQMYTEYREGVIFGSYKLAHPEKYTLSNQENLLNRLRYSVESNKIW